MVKTKKKEIDMINGPLMGKIIIFCVPLMLSSILQLLFNAADIVVVGQFAGKQSLGAVGSTGGIINLITNLFIGLSIGANVVMSNAIGANKLDKASRVVHTSMLLAVISGLIAGVAGFFAARAMLELMRSPENIIDKAELYLKIYFLGSPASLVYNFGASVLRAKGDTVRPLYFLLIAGVLNVLFNLFFVIVCKMDVAGVALATIISQAVSAVLVVICLMRETDYCKLFIRKLRLHAQELKEIIKIGIPAGIYSSMFSIANLIIQTAVNGFGDNVVAGNSSATNLEGFVYAAMNSVYSAAITFTSQNRGAKRFDRIKIILRDCLFLVTVVGISAGGLCVLLRQYLARIYSPDPEVIAYCVKRMTIIMPTYFLCGLMDVMMGMLRGMGYSTLPTINSFLGVCVVRIVWVFTVFAVYHTLEVLYLSFVVSWAVAGIAHAVTFAIVFRKAVRQNEAEKLASVPSEVKEC